MLARHLLFIATRQHHNTVLAIESVPPHGMVQPPPYISPPLPEECQKEKVQEILKDASQAIHAPVEKQRQQQHCGRQVFAQKIYTQNPRRNLYNNNILLERNRGPGCNEYQQVGDQRQIMHMRNSRNLQYYAAGRNVGQQFYTLPSRRPHRDVVEPPRSVTPDITRGLGRGSLSSMHMLARHGQKGTADQDSNRYGSQVELSRRNSGSLEAENRLTPNQQQQPIVNIRNRFATPLGLTAVGYRFFASSPVRDPVTKSPGADALKHNPISPIGHACGNNFKTSMPTSRSTPTVAERLALAGGNNCTSPMPNSGRSTPVQSLSGRTTPTNLVLSPTKSTMSNEELFAAIHKSKKRLNIRDDNENLSPYGSTNSLARMPNESRQNMVAQNAQPPPATSRLDFKRLLLQQSVKTGPTRLSAAEQLKLSRQQCQQQHHQQSPNVQQTASLAKVLSPRSIWRFHTPRTDVLSSTIIEDTAAEEKAMKPSPENTSPVSKLNARRQLDLCSDLPESFHGSSLDSRTVDACNDRLSPSNPDYSDGKRPSGIEPSDKTANMQQTYQKLCNVTNNNNCLTAGCASNSSLTASLWTATSASDRYPENEVTSPATIHHSSSSSAFTPSCQQAINAFESRRISNQLARAQFLAGMPTTTNQGQNNFTRNEFRARSESPQNSATRNVCRSPSAPALETAL